MNIWKCVDGGCGCSCVFITDDRDKPKYCPLVDDGDYTPKWKLVN